MTVLQTFRDGPRRTPVKWTRWQNALGTAMMFVVSLGVIWLMVRYLRLTWDQALLVQILWLTVMNRWHQPDRVSFNGEANG